jgi:hypothetical protein
MLKAAFTALVASAIIAPTALAGPAERAGRIDHRLTLAEVNGAWAQGSRADHIEDRLDRREDVIDRRENRRDEAVDLGRWDVIEDRLDRREDRRDRRENRIDRRH